MKQRCKRPILTLLILGMLWSVLLCVSAHAVTPPSTTPWYDESEAYTGEYAYSIAVVGDTQTLAFQGAKETPNAYTESLPKLYQWIADNAEAKKMQYVIGLGDITEKGEDWGHKNNDTEAETAVGDREWAYAKEAISKMNGVIPYTLVRGSGHDGYTRFNEWFADYTPYTENIAGYYTEGEVGSVYHTFEVCNTKYLILCLDFGAQDPVLEWANEVVASHADHKVIVTTHGYLKADGSLLATGDDYCPSQSYYDKNNNDGDDIWEKFVKKHENITMVISGHMTCDDVVIDQVVGEKGNSVTHILIDPQGIDKDVSGGYGMVAMMYFSEDGEDVAIEYYSTLKNKYRQLKTVDLTHVHEYESVVVEPTCTDYGETVRKCVGCGKTLGRSDFKRPLGHEYDDAKDTECNRCGAKRVAGEGLNDPIVTPPNKNDSSAVTVPEGFPGWGIALIAVGGFAVVGGAIALIVFFMTRTKKTK